MKNIKKILFCTIIIILALFTNVEAHNKNITGCNEKDSKEITQNDGKFYGYHNENEVRHYHQVEWDEENQKWKIVNPAVYYDENFNIIDAFDGEETEKIEVEFYKKVDGDTAQFELDGKIIKVRFLGINTPETVDTTTGVEPYGEQASNYTLERLENANKVELEYDKNSSKEDPYNRILAWIWVDDSLLQKELIERGLAETYMLQNNYRYAGILQLAEEEAKENKVGIWNDGTEIGDKLDIEQDENSGFIGILIIIILMIIAILAGNRKKKQNNQ